MKMFQLLQKMEQLLFFLEIVGYVAIALMLLQIFLTIGVLVFQKYNDSSNETSKESSVVRESHV